MALTTNPLIAKSDAPYGAPLFHTIERKHFIPAVEHALALAREEIKSISNNPKAPTFSNTLEAMDFAGRTLEEVSSILFNLNHAETNPELQAIARSVSPMLTDFSNDVMLNEKLFLRVKEVFGQRKSLGLSPEQNTLLDKTYKNFVRSGANLNPAQKEQYRAITRELSELKLQFDENVLADTNSFHLHITNPDDLKGLPDSLVEAALHDAQKKQLEGWVITLHAPMFVPFMKYSQIRHLREHIYRAYASRGNRGGKTDNNQLISRITHLRLQKAQLLGYPTYAHYVLEERMALSPDRVTGFLDSLIEPSKPFAASDLKEIEGLAEANGEGGTIQKWDWAFYSELLKQQRFNLREEELKPYFSLGRVKEGIFRLANTLFGIRFNPTTLVPSYHPDVETFEVFDTNGEFLALLYLDFFPREGKSGGAWMTTFRPQYRLNGRDVRPLVSLVCNFTKPTPNAPALLTFGEVTTFLHEFGHALHGMLAQSTYPSLSGTSVFRDFVELPSQLMENWALECEFLDSIAQHYQTGETIPQTMVRSIIDSRNFQAGFQSLRQLTFGILDLAWHSLTSTPIEDVKTFEDSVLSPLNILPPVEGTAISPSFSHIFAGGYAAGYYSYKWAEVLDADAYALFQQKGIFNREVAESLRRQILSAGGSEHPMILYKRFRGKEPEVKALLERSGLHITTDKAN